MGQRSIENVLLGGQGRAIALKGETVRRAILLVSMIMVMLLVGSGVALADNFTGTDGPTRTRDRLRTTRLPVRAVRTFW